MKSIDTIIGIGAMFYRIERRILTGPKRDSRTVRLRNSIMGICCDEGHSLSDIGAGFHRHHGAVSNSLENLTPEYMGGMWARHQALKEVVESSEEAKISESLEVLIGEIDDKIRLLQEARKLMIDARYRAYYAETPDHWQEK